MAFHPYLYFDGNCREAFTRYQELFGGELMLMTGHDAPPGTEGIPADKMDLVMHVSLMGDGELLMASDSYDEFTPMNGSYVHYTTTDIDRAKAIFAGLCEGGDVQVEGREEFWTPFWGMCCDRFSINWQISVEQSELALAG